MRFGFHGLRSGRVGLLIVALVFVECLRQLLFVALGPASVVLDAAEYWRSGAAVARGDWLQLTINTPYRTPFYAYWLAVPQRWCGDWALLTVVLAQHLIVLGTTLFTCLWAVKATGRTAFGILAYVLFWPLMTRFWYANAILTETLFAFPFTIGVGLLLLYDQRPRWILALWAGLFLGIATLVRPVPQLLIPALAILWIGMGWTRWSGWSSGRTARHAALFVGVFGVVLLPCLARNQWLYGQLFLTRLPAVNRWAVAFRDGSGGDLPWPDSPAARRMEAILQTGPGMLQDRHGSLVQRDLITAGLAADESEALMAQVSMDAINQEPASFLWKAFKRIVNFWRCSSNSPPYGGSEPPDFQQQAIWQLPTLAGIGRFFSEHQVTGFLWWNQLFSLATFAAAVRLCWVPHERWKGLVLLATMGYFCTLTGLVEIENYRYRMVLEPLMVWSCVLAIATLFPKRQPAGSADRPLAGGTTK